MRHKFRSTRGQDSASIDEAILMGLARDGGLFIPEQFPAISIKRCYEHSQLTSLAKEIMSPFFYQSKIVINDTFCRKVFNFSTPLIHLEKNTYILELFHGPTLSFKDLCAQFFSECLSLLLQKKTSKVIVATSGDTGGAVAQAMHGKRNIEGIILFPKNKISIRQQAQISCWGDNIHALAVNGDFDQCQELVKQVLSESPSNSYWTTANSINIARLLPQIIFYAFSSIQLAIQHNSNVNFIVPSGNLGNVTACYWAKYLGFPIEEIWIANNANHVLHDFLRTGVYKPENSITTLATAMDVGDPSNLERLLALFTSLEECREALNVQSVRDEDIKTAIKTCYNRYQYILCPHTATAYHRYLSYESKKPCVIVSTAHPAKFAETIEPLINASIKIPHALEIMLSKKQTYSEIEPNLQSLKHFLVG